MKRTIMVSSLVVLAALLASSPAHAQRIDLAKRGLILAKHACAECHSVEKGSLSSPNPAAPCFEDIANTPGMTATAISAALHTSHRTMPNVILHGDDLNNILLISLV